MKIENAIDFLLYSVMGVTRKSEPGDLLKGAIDRAYRDACSHVLSVRDDKKKEEVRIAASKTIEDALEKAPVGEGYDKWHVELCHALIEKYKDKTDPDNPFTYGIAQKWVNMTMKYLFVLKAAFKQLGTKWPAELAFVNEDLEKSLHVPIDGYIITAVFGEMAVPLPMKEGYTQETREKKKNNKYLQDYVKPWSKWDADGDGNCKDYTDFQAEIKNVIKDPVNPKATPLDWENDAWLKIAEQRKKQENKAKSSTDKK